MAWSDAARAAAAEARRRGSKSPQQIKAERWLEKSGRLKARKLGGAKGTSHLVPSKKTFSPIAQWGKAFVIKNRII